MADEMYERAAKAEQQLEVIANDLDLVGIQRTTTGGDTPRDLPVWNRVDLLRARMERAETVLREVEAISPAIEAWRKLDTFEREATLEYLRTGGPSEGDNAAADVLEALYPDQ